MFARSIPLFAVLILVAYPSAQQAEIVDAYSFGACKVAVADPAASLVFSGAGSGAFVLDVSDRTDPQPLASYEAGLKDINGFVWDVAVTNSHLYFAARRMGLVIHDRQSYTRAGELELDDNGLTAEAHAVGVVEFGTDTYAFVGSVDEDGSGRLFLVDASNPGDPQVLDFIDVGAGIYTIDAWVDPSTSTARVLVGLACFGGPGSDAAVLRYNVPLSGTPSLPSPTATWTNFGLPAFVRDIVSDDVGSSHVAYVATHDGFVHQFDVSSGLVADTLSGWPVFNQFTRPHGLALIEELNLLAVARGPAFKAETQYWAGCSLPTPCYLSGEETVPSVTGVALFDMTTGAPKGTLAVVQSNPEKLPKEPVGITTLGVDTGNSTFHLAVACDVWGCQIVEGIPSDDRWQMERIGAWDRTDAGAGVPALSLGAFDGLTSIGDYVYAGNESGVCTLASSDLSTLVDYDESPAVIVVGHEGSDGTRLFSTGSGPGLVIWDVDADVGDVGVGTPVNPWRAPGDLLSTSGEAIGVYPISAPPFEDPSLSRTWFYVANVQDATTAPPRSPLNGGVRVFRIAPGGMSPSDVEPLGFYAVSASDPGSEGDGAFTDVVAVPELDNTQIVWASFGPLLDEEDAGLMTFRAIEHHTQEVVELLPLIVDSQNQSSKRRLGIPAGTSLSTGLLTYDATREWLYGGFGCAGVAAFDVSTPDCPGPACRLVIPGEVVISVALAPDNHLYVGLMGKGYIAVVDASNPASWSASTSVEYHPTRFQAVDMIAAPTTDTPLDSLFVGDARGGVLKVYFPGF